jgi:hypothetical protein
LETCSLIDGVRNRAIGDGDVFVEELPEVVD